jgi:hypothetical protein
VASATSLPELTVYFGRQVLKFHLWPECPGTTARETRPAQAHTFRATCWNQAHRAGWFLCKDATGPLVPERGGLSAFQPRLCFLSKYWETFRN